MNIENINQFCYIVDKCILYKLTIVTPLIFDYKKNSLLENIKLLNNCSKQFVIHNISKIRKNLLKNKYSKLLDYNDLVPLLEHFNVLGSFEVRSTDKAIHFHYVMSNLVEFRNNNSKYIDDLEIDTVKSYNNFLERCKHYGKISDYHFDVYIKHNEYIKNHPHARCFIRYILKDYIKYNLKNRVYEDYNKKKKKNNYPTPFCTESLTEFYDKEKIKFYKNKKLFKYDNNK